jgi:hypothetical protein
MISSFTLLVWVPRVAAAPGSRAPWTALLASSALTGAAWAVGAFIVQRLTPPVTANSFSSDDHCGLMR